MVTMYPNTTAQRIFVHPFARRLDDDDVIIGRPETGVFIALPKDAVELLDWLAEGKTVDEAEASYLAKYGEVPAIWDLLTTLERKGFVQQLAANEPGGGADAEEGAAPGTTVRYHFTSIPRWLAALVFGTPALCVYGLVITLSIVALCVEPTAISSSVGHLFVSGRLSARTLGVMAVSYATLFLHEMAHLVAARAAGVSSRLGIGHRLWFLVAETDMTGIWMLPRRSRYLPLLAGPLADLTVSAAMVLVLFASGKGLITLPAPLPSLCLAAAIISLFRLSWQCYFFLRTDFYYVLMNLLHCKNLMGDTETFLRDRFVRLLGRARGTPDPLEGIPRREMRAIRGYAMFWILGRIGAFAVLFLLQLPLFARYLGTIHRAIRDTHDVWEKVDAVFAAAFVLTNITIGIYLWLRNLFTRRSNP